MQQSYHALQLDPLILTIDNLLSGDVCQYLIEKSEKQGYEKAKIHLGNGKSQTHLNIRNNDRVIFVDKDLAQQLFVLVRSFLPHEIIYQEKKWQLIGLNDDFRYYRYQVGQRFKAHLDGSYQKDKQQSFLTILFYLNDDYQGGETKFYQKNDTGRLNLATPQYVIAPKKGDVLIFRHEQFHEGAEVLKGVKYVLRSDVMYAQGT